MEGCHPQPTALFSVVRRWILYVPPGPDFLDDETTLRGPFGGPNLSAGVLAGRSCCGSGGFSNVSWMSPSRVSSRTKGRFALGGVITTPPSSSVRMVQVLPNSSAMGTNLLHPIGHCLPDFNHHVSLLPGVDVCRGLCHPVAQVSPLVS